MKSPILVRRDGSAVAIYDETLDLRSLGGAVSHRRASHVEPTPCGDWSADLSPVGGPTLGPYNVRSEALAAERDWLQDHLSSLLKQETP